MLKQSIRLENYQKYQNNRKKRFIISCVCFAIIVVFLGITLNISWNLYATSQGVGVNPESDMYKGELTKEELSAWNEGTVDSTRVIVQMKNHIEIQNNQGTIRLINPLYSSYSLHVEIILTTNEETVIGESEKILPGTFVATITIDTTEIGNEADGIARFTFYDGADNVVETYDLPITMQTI